ncbi:MAG: hypothetical protein BYD32DRAFT_480799 [Podila humilis]|nr:MAG: hypothetical protein BYD32DRAFT_480799 [Podila humilis]
MLKGRWSSLKELPIRIRKGAKKQEDLTRAMDWIQVCIVLHKFLVDENDVSDLTDWRCLQYVGHGVPGNPDHHANPAGFDAGRQFREHVMGNVLAVGHGLTGILTYEQIL